MRLQYRTRKSLSGLRCSSESAACGVAPGRSKGSRRFGKDTHVLLVLCRSRAVAQTAPCSIPIHPRVPSCSLVTQGGRRTQSPWAALGAAGSKRAPERRARRAADDYSRVLCGRRRCPTRVRGRARRRARVRVGAQGGAALQVHGLRVAVRGAAAAAAAGIGAACRRSARPHRPAHACCCAAYPAASWSRTTGPPTRLPRTSSPWSSGRCCYGCCQ